MKKETHSIGISQLTATLILAVMILGSVFTSCKKEKKAIIDSFSDPKDVPSLSTFDVNTLISDSGVTRYRIQAKEWRVFDKADEPYWYFPQGIFVEKFDSGFNTESFILSDTAIFYNAHTEACRITVFRNKASIVYIFYNMHSAYRFLNTHGTRRQVIWNSNI